MRILLAEDDKDLNKALTWQLSGHGYSVDSCFDGDEALYYGAQDIYDVILLDRMLPCQDGTEVLTALRRQSVHTPVILITALGTLEDKIEGRSAVLRAQPDALVYQDVAWSGQDMCLTGPTGNSTLSRREGSLLESFLHMPEQTIARETLLLKVWGPDSDVEEGNLDNYVYFLRRRLKAVGSLLQIKTVRGVGYKV